MASRRGRRLAIVAASLVLVIAPVASAQTASDRETARSLMDEGFARREKGDHRGALERFEAADSLMHVPTTGLETARERVALGMLIEARELLSAVARYPTRAGEPAPFGEARMHAQRLDDEIGARIPQLRIVLRGAEGPAAVTVDGAEVPAATLITPRRVNPGTHTVVARAAGRERREQITMRERETKEILLDLTLGTSPALATPPPLAPASSPSSSPPADKGDAAAGAPAGTPHILFWAGIATAGAGVLVGTVTGVMSLSAVSSAKSGCIDAKQCPPATYDDIDRARTLGNVSTVSFVLAGGGVALAVVGYFLGKSDEPSASASGLVVGPMGAAYRGLF